MSQRWLCCVAEKLDAPLKLESSSVPRPVMWAVIARVDLACVCSTDVHLHHGYLAIPTSIVLGHRIQLPHLAAWSGVRTDFLDNSLGGQDWDFNLSCAKHCWCVVTGERTLCETRTVLRRQSGLRRVLLQSMVEANYVQPGSAIFRLPDNLSTERVNALGCA